MVLDSEDGLSVVAEAGDIDAALRATRELRPRVVVLDLNMPGEPTLPAIPRFLEAAPDVAVVVLTMESDPVFARRALVASRAPTCARAARGGEPRSQARLRLTVSRAEWSPSAGCRGR
jgi:two-component system response regulator NreC